MIHHPKVFISYSWDSPEHKARVLKLSDDLRKEGIDCNIDVYDEASPSEGWPRWMGNQLEWADFVVVVCTEVYNNRFKGKEEPGIGLGVIWEGGIISQELYNASGKSTKFVPVIFSSKDGNFIPTTIMGFSRYDLSTEEGYRSLYYRLTGQSLHPKPPLGEIVELVPRVLSPLPARKVRQDFIGEQKYLGQIRNQELLPNNPIIKYFDNELAPILENIDFQICKGVFNKVLPDFELSSHCPIINIEDLKQLLLYEYSTKLSDGSLPIIKFADCLANDNRLKEPVRHEFRDWAKKVIKELDLSYSSNFNMEIYELNSYLIILIEPQDNQFYINAYLIPNDKDKASIEPINLGTSQRGTFCSYKEIEATIAPLIRKSLKKLIEITTKPYKLTIEFFLTIDYLHEKVEHWRLADSEPWNKFPIGEKYKVVVRSYDRLKYPESINALRKGRKILEDFRESNEQNIDDIIEHLKELDNCNWQELKDRLEKKIGLKLTCSLPVTKKERKELFKTIVLSGISIAIWIRPNNITNISLEDEIQKFYNVGNIMKFSTLFELLQEERKKAYYAKQKSKDYLGYHIGILCEEPNLEEFPDLKLAINDLFR